MEKVRLGIIGFGNMGSAHAEKIFAKKVSHLELTAICDIDPNKIKAAKELYGGAVKYYDSPDAFFSDGGAYDAVCVAVPHYDHPPLAIKAFSTGKHVMVEKPAGVYTGQVREMNEAAAKSDRVFGIMYNQRTNPIYKKIRDMIKSGELGELKRMVWIITNWYRPQSYHDSSMWRSTWSGEGGGVLLNQDPHQLDLWQWMVGMPERVRGFCAFGKYYDIEVEDDVTAYAEYQNGMTATFITATGEAPGTNRLEISGTMGKLVAEKDRLTFYRNQTDEREFNRTYKGSFGTPECWTCEIPVDMSQKKEHMGIFQNFTNAILKGEKLLAPGEEGIHGLTISNAIHLSSWIDDWVTLPIDEDLFYQKLSEKIKNSTFKKKKVVSRIADVKNTH